MPRRIGPRFCPHCDEGVAEQRNLACKRCRVKRHRAAARAWWARNKRSRAGEPTRKLTAAQIERHRLRSKALRVAGPGAAADRLMAEWASK